MPSWAPWSLASSTPFRSTPALWPRAFPDALGWLNSIPSHLFKALPFLITAIVLVVTSIRKREGSGQPAALGLNYFREER